MIKKGVFCLYDLEGKVLSNLIIEAKDSEAIDESIFETSWSCGMSALKSSTKTKKS